MIYIVGNGLFGRIAHDLLEANDIPSLIIDDSRENSGTSASGNIMKPSWLSGIEKKVVDKAYSDLEDLYGLIKFSPVKILGQPIELFRVERKHTLKSPDINRRVAKVGDGFVELDTRDLPSIHSLKMEGKILIAAGVWTNEIVDVPQIESIVGASAIFSKPNHKPRLDIWAPYKQSISYGFENDLVWFGDGTAIKKKNFSPNHIESMLKRASAHGLEAPLSVNVGYRPYIKNHKNGYFARIHPNTWVSTGGGKNGIVLAAIQARKFLEEL